MRRLFVLVLAVAAIVLPPAAGIEGGASGASPGSDYFSDATPLEIAEAFSFNTTGATEEPGEPVHAGTGLASVWFVYEPSEAGTLRLDTGGSGFDTVLAAYAGYEVHDLQELASNDDADDGRADSATSHVVVHVSTDLPAVFIAVAGVEGATGPAQLSWTFDAATAPPAEDPDETDDSSSDGGSSGTNAGRGAEVTNVATTDTVAAAIAISRAAFADGQATHALLARADLFADTLAGGGLAGDRPLLLTSSDRLPQAVTAELGRLGTTNVLVLGGPAAVSDAVLQQLADQGITARRAYGAGRIETAVAIADVVRKAHSPTTAIIARGYPAPGAHPTQAFADSMAAGAWAAAEGWPILLSHTDRLSDATRAHLVDAGYERVILVGGKAALSAQVAAAVDAVAGRVDRVAGASRAETAVAIAKARGAGNDHVVVVDGYDANGWAIGLPAASLGARQGSAVLLATADELAIPTRDFLATAGPLTATCASGESTCARVHNVLDRPGVPCTERVEYWIEGCRAEVAGLPVKFFPPPGDAQIERLVMYFHGDTARDWDENWGFNAMIIDWAHRRNMLVLGFLSPADNDRGQPAYGYAGSSTVTKVDRGIAEFMERYAVRNRQSLVWSASGGSWFISGYFVPGAGHRWPGIFAVSCGGHVPVGWEWDPQTDAATRARNAFLFNYGDQDFLADAAAASHRNYSDLGFHSEELVHEGAEHCRHDIEGATMDFWEAQLS